jgi:hypothetical protein
MPTLLSSILRTGIRRPDDKLNILTFPTHERYQTGLSLTGHNFFLYTGQGIKNWDAAYAPLPANHVLLPYEAPFPIDLDFDVILSQNKFGQYPVADSISKQFNIPLISLEHTLPYPSWPIQQTKALSNLRGHINVYISNYSVQAWSVEKDYFVIEHGVDTSTFYDMKINRQPVILSVVNDWINRDYCCGFKLWQQVTNGLSTKVLGNTPGLSKPATSVSELVRAYNESMIFLNTSLISPVPTVLLEAMACGCAVVSTANCMIPEFITHEENGLMGNTPEELRFHLERLIENPELCKKLGHAAQKTIKDKFSIDKFVLSWNNIFRRATNIIPTYIGDET